MDNSNELHFNNEANIPGAAGVIRCHGGVAFYCTVHKHEIQPVMFDTGEEEIPCCEECILEEMIEEGREVKAAETETIDDTVMHDIQEDVWECMT